MRTHRSAQAFMPATAPIFSATPRSRTRCGFAASGWSATAHSSSQTYVDRAIRRLELRRRLQALIEDACAASSTSSLPRRSIGSRETRQTSPASTSACLCRRRDRHARRGRDQRAPYRPQGHDEPALPQGSRRQDATRLARPGRGGPLRRRRGYGYDVVRSCAATGEPHRGERRINRAEAADRAPHLPSLRRRRIAAGDCRSLNREGIPRPAGGAWGASTIHGNPKRGTGILNNELYHRPAGLEPAALCQGPGDRQARVAAEPAGALDRAGGAGAAHRRRRRCGSASRRGRRRAS